MDAFNGRPMPRAQAIAMREELYKIACSDLGGLRDWVYSVENIGRATTALPAQAEMREAPLGGETTQQDQLDYLRALVTEMRQLGPVLTRLSDRLPNPQPKDYDKGLEIARCSVRMKELGVDWEIATSGNQRTIDEAKRIVERIDATGQTALSPDEITFLRSDIRVWDEGFPAIKADWETSLSEPIRATGSGRGS